MHFFSDGVKVNSRIRLSEKIAGKWSEKPLLSLALLAAVIFGVYANSLNNDFHYDDQPTIVKNQAIRSLGNIPSFFLSKQGFSTDELYAAPKHYRPVLLTTYAVNYAIDGLNPPVYHLTNILLHILSTVLVYLIVLNLSSDLLAARLAAVIYGLHPIHTEALNYVSARSSLLSGFFFLLAFYSFIKFRLAQTQKTRAVLTLYFIFFFSFVLAVLSKEVAVVLPLMLVVYDLYYSGTSLKGYSRQMLIPYGPFILPLVFYLIVGRVHHMIWSILQGYGAREFWPHLLTQAKVTVQYILLFLWPVDLTPDRRLEVANSVGEGAVLASLGVIGMLLGTAYGLLRIKSSEARACSLGLLWFFLTSLPTIVVPLNLLIQEHRSYLPVAGLAIAVGSALSWFYRKCYGFQRVHHPGGRRAVYSSTVPLVMFMMIMGVGYGILVVKRNAVWKNDISLWSDAASKPSAGFRAHVNLGTAYERQGRLDLAIQSYKRAIEIEPAFFATHYNLGLIYQRLGSTDLAIAHYQEAIQINPFFPLAHHKLGVVYTTIDRPDLAKQEFERALQLDGSDLSSKSALGWLYLTEERFEQAEDYFQQVLKVRPESLRDRLGMAVIYNQRHEFDKAIPEYEWVLRMDPDNLMAQYHLGLIHEALGNGESAVAHYRAVLDIAARKDLTHDTVVDLSRKRLLTLEKRG